MDLEQLLSTGEVNHEEYGRETIEQNKNSNVEININKRFSLRGI